jgi:hypothetical protein
MRIVMFIGSPIKGIDKPEVTQSWTVTTHIYSLIFSSSSWQRSWRKRRSMSTSSVLARQFPRRIKYFRSSSKHWTESKFNCHITY